MQSCKGKPIKKTPYQISGCEHYVCCVCVYIYIMVMVATGVVADVWDGGCHYRRPLALRYGYNWACGQNLGWRASLSSSSCTWS